MALFVWPTYTSTLVLASWYGSNSLYILERRCGWSESKATVAERKFKPWTSTFFKKASLFPQFFLASLSMSQEQTCNECLHFWEREGRFLPIFLSSTFSLFSFLQIHKLALRLMNHFACQSREDHGIDLSSRQPQIVISLFAEMSGNWRIAQRDTTWAKCQGLQLSTSSCHWLCAVVIRKMYFFSEHLHVLLLVFFADQDPVKCKRVVGANIMPELKGEDYLKQSIWKKLHAIRFSLKEKGPFWCICQKLNFAHRGLTSSYSHCIDFIPYLCSSPAYLGFIRLGKTTFNAPMYVWLENILPWYLQPFVALWPAKGQDTLSSKVQADVCGLRE